jgi:quercetin dioxygenase-like cupin family protein
MPAAAHRGAMESSTVTPPFVLTAEAIATLPVERLGSIAGVSHRVVWRSGNSMAGVMTVQAGYRLGTHSHRANDHHLWVLRGHVRLLDIDAGPGSYAHVPSGVDHDLDTTETEGCTVFYLYLSPTG